MTTPTRAPSYDSHVHSHPRVIQWGAVLAGAVTALALHILFMMLGAGLGLAVYNPLTSDEAVAHFSAGAAVIQGISALLSLWVGGWVAGRCVGRNGLQTGCLHGFMVWSVSTIAAIALLATGLGWAMGTLSSIVGGGLAAAGKPAAAVVPGVAEAGKEALLQQKGMMESFVAEGTSQTMATNSPGAVISAKRNLAFAVSHLFTSEDSPATSQQAVVTLLMENQGMSEAEARKVVEDWTETYGKLKTDLAAAKERLELKAKEAAEKTAKGLAVLSLCYFAAFLLGAIGASWGGKNGGTYGYKRAELEAVEDNGALTPSTPDLTPSRPSVTAVLTTHKF